jgi:enoyl-CoA hydratase/carnithine racemase
LLEAWIGETERCDWFLSEIKARQTINASGVLVVEFHSNDGPCTFSSQHHTEVVDAFHRIAQDRANKIVILTGASGDFIIGVDWASFGDVADPDVWSQIHDEALRFWKT